MTRSLEIINPGMQTTVQDAGRIGFQRFGVSVSGAADRYSFQTGNRLIGNEENAPAIEVAMGGLQVKFNGDSTFALTGADCFAELDGIRVGTNLTYEARDGSILTFGFAQQALRAYLCIAGGIDVTQTLDSASTHVASEIGGYEGRAVIAGDLLSLGAPGSVVPIGSTDVNYEIPAALGSVTVRAVLGPQDDQFSEEGIKTFFDSKYVVTDQSNRQGVRLDGAEIESKDGRYDIVSDAVMNGSVQIPGDGKPIVLLADRQTTGGYAKIATVISIDLPKLGQLRPGDELSFEQITVEDAQQLVRDHAASEPSQVVQAVEPELFTVNGAHHHVGVAHNNGARLVSVDGTIYPVDWVDIDPK
jgi:antagonist of KipI